MSLNAKFWFFFLLNLMDFFKNRVKQNKSWAVDYFIFNRTLIDAVNLNLPKKVKHLQNSYYWKNLMEKSKEKRQAKITVFSRLCFPLGKICALQIFQNIQKWEFTWQSVIVNRLALKRL